jgi:hypothetical protein
MVLRAALTRENFATGRAPKLWAQAVGSPVRPHVAVHPEQLAADLTGVLFGLMQALLVQLQMLRRLEAFATQAADKLLGRGVEVTAVLFQVEF